MTTDWHFLPLPYSLASSRAYQLSFILFSSRTSLLIITSMILVFLAVFLMLAKLFNHSILFDRLLHHELSPVVTRALLNWYSDHNVYPGIVSFSNIVSNGVCQGGVLSPILFTVYIDDLLTELEKKGVG